MRHFPARAYPARIETTDAARAAGEIINASRRQFWISIGQMILSGLIGFAAGVLFAFGYWFEATGGWR